MLSSILYILAAICLFIYAFKMIDLCLYIGIGFLLIATILRKKKK